MKNAIIQVAYFLNGPMFNLCFVVILFYIARKWLLMGNLATILPLKSKFSAKFQRFNAVIEKLNFKKIQLK